MTKAFLRGRTETIRTVQPHTLDFVRAWTDPKAKMQTKLTALRAACAGHTKLSKDCAAGKGFDRYVDLLTQPLLRNARLVGEATRCQWRDYARVLYRQWLQDSEPCRSFYVQLR